MGIRKNIDLNRSFGLDDRLLPDCQVQLFCHLRHRLRPDRRDLSNMVREREKALDTKTDNLVRGSFLILLQSAVTYKSLYISVEMPHCRLDFEGMSLKRHCG